MWNICLQLSTPSHYGTYYYADGDRRLDVMEATDSNPEYGFMEDSDTRAMDRNSQYGYN